MLFTVAKRPYNGFGKYISVIVSNSGVPMEEKEFPPSRVLSNKPFSPLTNPVSGLTK